MIMRAAPDRLELHVSYDCRNRCVFCSEACRLARFRGKNPTQREIVAILRAKRSAGFRHVTFTGGEPSLLPYLPRVLAAARAMGYLTCLTTNGEAFANPRYAAQNLAALDELILSVHGADSSTHDALTRTPGSFARTAAALANISALAGGRFFLITNTLAVKSNFTLLPGVLDWLGNFGAVKQFLVSYPAPEGRAAADYGRLAPDLREFSEMAPRLCGVAARRKKIIRFFGVPACALGAAAGYSNDFHWSPRLTVERGLRGGVLGFREVLSGAPVRKRFYPAACAGCRFMGLCGGVFKLSGSARPGWRVTARQNGAAA
ncbi:MAG: hypothetical protein A2234_11315 [Elusimicrobia bacterium RIFOXYA2_FULL_58_8]|nr:MAG: hypothetical protein A2285_04945 [Elusimicrobia bacterium RIFOXYA12_FULL_57_11]OGS14528.1 MAG: hypothetical protein A2234_11315 [Elusimicrobia bacterium RIFOXYA2_FULL_58_8]